jgi:hypothetical protein
MPFGFRGDFAIHISVFVYRLESLVLLGLLFPGRLVLRIEFGGKLPSDEIKPCAGRQCDNCNKIMTKNGRPGAWLAFVGDC